MYRRFVHLLAAAALFCSTLAYAGSTVDPNVPAQGSSLSSAPIRGNFAAAANDINHILGMFAGVSAPSSPSQYQLWANTATTPTTVNVFDGSSWVALGFLDTANHLWIPPVGGGVATLASGISTDLGSLPHSSITITGTATVTTFGTTAKLGQIKYLTFAGTPTLTYNSSSLILPGLASITTAAGDTAIAQRTSAGWRVLVYQSAAGGLLPNSVGNSALAQMPANTVKCNPTGSTANAVDCTATQGRTALGLGTAATQATTAFLQPANNLLDVASAATARTNLVAAASGANSDITSLTGITTPLSTAQGGTGTATPGLVAGTNVTVTGSWPNQTIASGSNVSAPQGRLTLVSGVPVMTSDQLAKSQVFYPCYIGKLVPYFDGTSDQTDAIPGCQVSLIMQPSGAGATNSGGVFDIFWVHSGASRICVATNGSGGGWASDTSGSNTARGTGYSAVHNTRGYWTNTNSIANCYNGTTNYGTIAADQGTYLGTLYTTAAGQTGMAFTPAAAAGGTNIILGLSNGYNRRLVTALCLNNHASWTYATATWRAADNSNSFRISWVDGLQQSSVDARYIVGMSGVTGGTGALIGVNFNSTGSQPNYSASTSNSSGATLAAIDRTGPLMGFNFTQAVEYSTGATSTFSGQVTGGIVGAALLASLEM